MHQPNPCKVTHKRRWTKQQEAGLRQRSCLFALFGDSLSDVLFGGACCVLRNTRFSQSKELEY